MKSGLTEEGSRLFYAHYPTLDSTNSTLVNITAAIDSAGKPRACAAADDCFDADIYCADMSSDGEYVVFISDATNLVTGQPLDRRSLFVWRRSTGILRAYADTSSLPFSSYCRLQVADDGKAVTHFGSRPSYSQSNPGASRRIAAATMPDAEGIWLFDPATEEFTLVSKSSDGTTGNEFSYSADITADGRYVFFESGSSNLVADDTNNVSDIFRRDLQMGTTIRVSTNSNGSQRTDASAGPRASSDGRYVLFMSFPVVNGNVVSETGTVLMKKLETGVLTNLDISASAFSVTATAFRVSNGTIIEDEEVTAENQPLETATDLSSCYSTPSCLRTTAPQSVVLSKVSKTRVVAKVVAPIPSLGRVTCRLSEVGRRKKYLKKALTKTGSRDQDSVRFSVPRPKRGKSYAVTASCRVLNASKQKTPATTSARTLNIVR